MVEASRQFAPSNDVVLIAANPKAGWQSRDHHLQDLAGWLQKRGIAVEITNDLQNAEQRAADLHRAGRLRALVGAGGDGTLAELVNRTEPSTPLAIYPTGTANLVARYVGVSTRVAEFGQMLFDSATVTLDAGRAGGRLFLAVCSCGFDAEVVRQVHEARTGHITSLAYVAPVVSALGSYRYPEIQVYCDKPAVEGGNVPVEFPIRARWAFVSNLPCYAAGLKPGVGASGFDGQLDLCTLTHGSWWNTVRYLPYMLRGTQRGLADCTMHRGSKYRLESAGRVPYELDGDPGGYLPVEIEILPRRLTLIVPQAFAAKMAEASEVNA